MGYAISNGIKAILDQRDQRDERCTEIMSNLNTAKLNKEYTIKSIITDDVEIRNFLFTLGCYEGERVTVLSVLSENIIINVKNSRYSIDKDLAEAIITE